MGLDGLPSDGFAFTWIDDDNDNYDVLAFSKAA
jgi:hypothetical protein